MFPEDRKKWIYLDHASSSPLRPEALEEMLPLFRCSVGNPSSAHAPGRDLHRILDDARERIAACIHAHPDEVFFTSGGTESNNWAISIGMRLAGSKHKALLTDSIEHHSVIRPLEEARRSGFSVSLLPVCRQGTVDVHSADDPAFLDAAFMSVMTVNNETGVIQPLNELTQFAHEHQIAVHTDAVQAIGHLPVDMETLKADYLSSSAHKFGGPVGTGFLYVRRGAMIEPFLRGGAQERGMRAGTENVALCVGMAAALETSIRQMNTENQSAVQMQEIMEKILLSYPGSVVFGSSSRRIPGIINICFPNVLAAKLIPYLDIMGIAVSAGAACTAGSAEISHVLIGMGIDPKEAQCSIRISIGRCNTADEIKKAASIILKEALRIGKSAVRDTEPV